MMKDQISTYEQLLSVRRLQVISTNVFKSITSLNPSFMKEIFNVKETSYNLRDSSLMSMPLFNKIMYGKTLLNIMVLICGIIYLLI